MLLIYFLWHVGSRYLQNAGFVFKLAKPYVVEICSRANLGENVIDIMVDMFYS